MTGITRTMKELYQDQAKLSTKIFYTTSGRKTNVKLVSSAIEGLSTMMVQDIVADTAIRDSILNVDENSSLPGSHPEDGHAVIYYQHTHTSVGSSSSSSSSSSSKSSKRSGGYLTWALLRLYLCLNFLW